jgi:hypothetical protein
MDAVADPEIRAGLGLIGGITGELNEYNEGLISVNTLKPTNFTYFEDFCGSEHVVIARSVRRWSGSDEKK